MSRTGHTIISNDNKADLIVRRKALNIPVTQMAKKIGISDGCLYSWEKNPGGTKPQNAALIMKAYQELPTPVKLNDEGRPVMVEKALNREWLMHQVENWIHNKELPMIHISVNCGVPTKAYMATPNDFAEFAVILGRVLGKDIGK